MSSGLAAPALTDSGGDFVVTGVGTASVGIAAEGGEPTDLPKGRASVRTDKNCYFPEEEVTIILKNVGGGLLIYGDRPDFEVESVQLGTVRMILNGFFPQDVFLSPGESITFLWNQLWVAVDENGNRIHPFDFVPEGEYTAIVRVPEDGIILRVGEVPFVIGACDVQVSAGDDLFVDEGQIFRLDPSVDETGAANLTSITWDLDPAVDANGDGNPRNDADLVGESPEYAFGDDGIYPVTLNVRGFLPNATRQASQDVVFVIDSSGSMQWNDPADQRKEATQRYADLLVPDDRAAVVDFDDSAYLVNDEHLSEDYDRVKQNIDLIDSFGGTFITPGLETALDEVQGYGHPNHHWIVILLTDAESITEDDDILIPIQVARAVSLGVRIFTVGLNVPPRLEPVMQGIATSTGGQFFPAPTPDALTDIYEAVLRAVRGRRGSFFLASDTLTVTVRNVAPTAVASAEVTATGAVNLTLRVAGEKWHDVVLTLLRDGEEAGSASVTRVPGSPDDQSATLSDATLFNGSVSVARVEYTPMDDPINGEVNGADPAWVTVAAADGTVIRFEHTFNVMHPDTWTWDVELTGLVSGGSAQAVLTTSIADPGSDDITITVDWGDGTVDLRSYYSDGFGPDPFPSPNGPAVSLTDRAVHEYFASGTYLVTLTVADDDGGITVLSFTVDA